MYFRVDIQKLKKKNLNLKKRIILQCACTKSMFEIYAADSIYQTLFICLKSNKDWLIV